MVLYSNVNSKHVDCADLYKYNDRYPANFYIKDKEPYRAPHLADIFFVDKLQFSRNIENKHRTAERDLN